MSNSGGVVVTSIPVEQTYTLADALYLTLKVSGTQIRSSPLPIHNPILPMGIKICVSMEVVSSSVSRNGEDIGLLVKVMGDLYLYAFHSQYERKVRLWVVDKRYLGGTMDRLLENNNVRSIHGAAKHLMKGVVQVYHRSQSGTKWEELDPAKEAEEVK